nr:uncharacterized protein LOC112547757 isoform X2 [Pelodiscus sinensis]|eukprot:XP_025046538.1 uncharacterized protein LOC112547757 isoform X2 [Pelodiscus sinensis]
MSVPEPTGKGYPSCQTLAESLFLPHRKQGDTSGSAPSVRKPPGPAAAAMDVGEAAVRRVCVRCCPLLQPTRPAGRGGSGCVEGSAGSLGQQRREMIAEGTPDRFPVFLMQQGEETEPGRDRGAGLRKRADAQKRGAGDSQRILVAVLTNEVSAVSVQSLSRLRALYSSCGTRVGLRIVPVACSETWCQRRRGTSEKSPS